MKYEPELSDDILRKFSIKEIIEEKLRRIIVNIDPAENQDSLYYDVIQEVEEALIRLALEATGNNQLQAAKILGINRNTLSKKAKRFKLKL